jgi:RNA polymerase sigma factor (sigma-70 family)
MSKQNTFHTYATYWIVQAMRREVSEHRLVRVPIYADPGAGGKTRGPDPEAARRAAGFRPAGMGSTHGRDREGRPSNTDDVVVPVEDHVAEVAERVEWVASLIASLPERERHVVRRRWFDGATHREIGEELGVRKQRSQQIEDRAMRRLREAAS